MLFLIISATNPEQKKCPYFGKFSVSRVTRKEGHTRPYSDDKTKSRPIDLISSLTSQEEPSEIFDTGKRLDWTSFSRPKSDLQLHNSHDIRFKREFEKNLNNRQYNYGLMSKRMWFFDGHYRFNQSLSRKLHRRKRELEGYSANEECSLKFKTLMVGCGSTDTMEFRSDCASPDANIVSGIIIL